MLKQIAKAAKPNPPSYLPQILGTPARSWPWSSKAGRTSARKSAPPFSPSFAPPIRKERPVSRPQIDGELRPYVPASWFHEKGRHKVVKRLMARMPDVSGKLFLTFTTSPRLFEGPESAFEHSRDRLRRIFYRLRKGVEWESKRYRIDAPYCVKLEFHESGWAHFHVIFLTPRFLPGPLLNHLWGIGRTEVQRISTKEFHYLLKYVSKSGELPDWVLSRKRLRVFQSSRGFLLPDERPKSPPTDRADDEKIPRLSLSIGERLERWERLAILRLWSSYRSLEFPRPYRELVGETVLSIAKDSRYLGNGAIQISDKTQLKTWKNKTKTPRRRRTESSFEASSSAAKPQPSLERTAPAPV